MSPFGYLANMVATLLETFRFPALTIPKRCTNAKMGNKECNNASYLNVRFKVYYYVQL